MIFIVLAEFKDDEKTHNRFHLHLCRFHPDQRTKLHCQGGKHTYADDW